MWIALLLLAMHPSVTVEGDAACPAPADVARHLSDLMASVADDVAPDRARLRAGAGAVTIDLVRADGSGIARRTLAADGTCADLASATAVVIATWEAQLRPQRLSRVTLGAEAPPHTVRPAPVKFDVGLGFMTFGSSGHVASGGALVGSVGRALGALGALSVSADRVDVVPGTTGTTSWTRATLALGARYRLSAERVRAEAFAAALATRFYAAGHGFATDETSTTTDFGAGLGARVALAWGNVAPWIGAVAQGWPESHDVAVNGVMGHRDVSSYELDLALGVSIGRF